MNKLRPLCQRFENFPKGDYFNGVMKDLFGDGIFAVDGEKWSTQRKTATHMFAAREFREVCSPSSAHGAWRTRRPYPAPPVPSRT